MATLEITISNKTKGALVAHEKFEISRELAQELVAKMEAMVADLPGCHRVTRTIAERGTIVEIALNNSTPPPASPSFEALYRAGEHDGRVG